MEAMSSAWLTEAVKEIIVYRSTSNCVWANLSFEDWIFKNVDLSFRRILFLWRNSPCVYRNVAPLPLLRCPQVVIGRHQNPWLEGCVPLMRERGVGLARRRSGGGAVYHDLGNLNCTVFTHRHDYSRPRNLRLVCEALNERWDTRLHVNQRDDIICNNRWKVSGTSAKLARDSAYHHFTLLLNVDTSNLHQLLKPHSELQFSQSSATQSTRSDVINLCSLAPTLTYEAACTAIARKFYDVHRVTKNRKVVDIDPTSESTFPGITEMREVLEDWEWNYGKSPMFSVTADKSFDFGHLVLTAEVSQGIIDSCNSALTSGNTDESLLFSLTELRNTLIGSRFWNRDVAMVTRPFLNSTELAPVCEWIFSLL